MKYEVVYTATLITYKHSIKINIKYEALRGSANHVFDGTLFEDIKCFWLRVTTDERGLGPVTIGPISTRMGKVKRLVDYLCKNKVPLPLIHAKTEEYIYQDKYNYSKGNIPAEELKPENRLRWALDFDNAAALRIRGGKSWGNSTINNKLVRNKGIRR